MLLRRILRDQAAMARHFWSDPRTRTPILVVWVASFGGALHASVTSFFYLEVGADEMDIGKIGFIMSSGALGLSPLAGWALDRWGPFPPLCVTAAACSVGCLVRGAAGTVRGLFVGAGLLGVGVNLWTVTLAHLANSTDRAQRSAVLSGFAVQQTCLQLAGKGLFPLWDLFVRRTLGFEETLPRYRIHMGICTFFCFFGTCALFAERLDLAYKNPTQNGTEATKLEQNDDAKSNAELVAHQSNIPSVKYAAIVMALLFQSIGSTVVSVLWPLVLRDRFAFAATEYGILAFCASLCATSAIAAFPAMERKLGSSRTAATCAAVSSICCFVAFVALPRIFTASTAAVSDVLPTDGTADAMLATRKGLATHAVLAIVLHGSLLALEPSLKSILSLAVPMAAQGRSLGFMSTLGGIGGMVGNLAGTWMFQSSKTAAPSAILGEGTLPFAVVAALLGLAAVFLYVLLEDPQAPPAECVDPHPPTEKCLEKGELIFESQDGNSASHMVQMGNGEECTQNHSTPMTHGGAHGLFSPLLHLETSYDLKLD